MSLPESVDRCHKHKAGVQVRLSFFLFIELFREQKGHKSDAFEMYSSRRILWIDPIHAVKAWNQASFSWIERHTEGDGTMMLRHRNVK